MPLSPLELNYHRRPEEELVQKLTSGEARIRDYRWHRDMVTQSLTVEIALDILEKPQPADQYLPQQYLPQPNNNSYGMYHRDSSHGVYQFNPPDPQSNLEWLRNQTEDTRRAAKWA